MGVQRQQVIAPSTTLASARTSDVVDVSDAQQLVVEILPSGLTGTLTARIEFSMAPSQGAWGAEVIDDVANGTSASGTMTVPNLKVERTWTRNEPWLIACPCGYAWVRVVLSASDNVGSVGVFINKVANRGG